MSEENAKKETIVVTPENPPAWINDCPSNERLVSNIKGKGTTAGSVFSVYFWAPQIPQDVIEGELANLDEAIKDRYNMSFNELLIKGVRGGISTAPHFPDAFDSEGNVDHDRLQEIADNWKAGRKATGESVKAKAAEMKALEGELAEAGMSLADVKALIAKAKTA